MIHAYSLPIAVIGCIFGRILNNNVESLYHWKQCLPLLALNRYWRGYYCLALYSNIIIECNMRIVSNESDCVLVLSNIQLVFASNFQNYVRTVVIYAPAFVNTGSSSDPMYNYISHLLEHWLGKVVTIPMSHHSRIMISSQITRILEPLFLRLPNILQMFFHTVDRREILRPARSMLLAYSNADFSQVRGALPDTRRSLINEIKMFEVGLYAMFMNRHSAFGEQSVAPMQLNYFCGRFVESMNMAPPTYTSVSRAILGDLLILENNSFGSTWPRYEQVESFRHVICHPRMRFINSWGQEVWFDIYRFIRTEHNTYLGLLLFPR